MIKCVRVAVPFVLSYTTKENKGQCYLSHLTWQKQASPLLPPLLQPDQSTSLKHLFLRPTFSPPLGYTHPCPSLLPCVVELLAKLYAKAAPAGGHLFHPDPCPSWLPWFFGWWHYLLTLSIHPNKSDESAKEFPLPISIVPAVGVLDRFRPYYLGAEEGDLPSCADFLLP